MQDVCIVTDSTADIPREMADELGITVVPLSVTIGNETFVDGELSMADFFRKMAAAPHLPTTSQPPVGAFVDAFQAALGHCREVVCVNISDKLSGTMGSAVEAARQFGERVHVVDSRNLSWGEGFQVIQAARAAASGASAVEVKRIVEEMRERMHLVVGLDTLENLAKGGRIGRVSAFLGGMLNVKVLLTVNREGTFDPVYRGRGTTAALQATVDWVAKRIDETKRAAFGVLHAESHDKAEWLEAQIRSRFTVGELHVIETGPVIGTHTGSGWGLAAVQLD
jgi:DegV family protein with EDD domain